VLYELLVAEFAGQRGDSELAARRYLEVARHTGDAGIAERATRVAVFARDEKRALEAAKLWSELDPDTLEARHIYAVLLMRVGRIDQAVAQFGTGLSDSSDASQENWYQISDILAREKDKERVIEVMGRLVEEKGGGPDSLFSYAHLLTRFGELKRAEELLKQVLAMNPKDMRAAVFYAQVLQEQGRTAQALDALGEALAVNPEERELRITYARLLVGGKRYEEALRQFEQLVKDSPEDADSIYALGLLLLQTNHPNEAQTQFQRLIELGNRVTEANYYLGQVAEAKDDPDAAIAAYRKVDRGEHYLSAHIRVAVLLTEQEGVQRGQQYLHALPRRNSQESIRLYRAEAEVLTEAEELDGAMAVYDRALVEHPENTDLLYARAMLAEKLDRLETVEADLRDILSREPNNADALNALGYTLADRTERYQEALDLINRALALKPDDPYVLDSMGWVLYRLGRHQEAVEHLQQALAASDEPDPEIAAHLGEVLWVMGKHAAARDVWETALKRTPGDQRILEAMKRLRSEPH
jgi:tetratricopeptide (TPR) repeat protein